MDNSIIAEQLANDGWRQHKPKGFTGLIGPFWSRREDGVLAFGLIIGDGHLNPSGVVHGGLLTTMLDQVVSTVAWEAAGRLLCVTVQLDIQFLAPVDTGVFLEARGEIVRQTRELIFARGELAISTAKAATGSAVLKILRRPVDV